MATYIPFLRVSTKKQDVARQMADITAKANQMGWPLAEPVQETVSRMKKNADRLAIQEVLKVAHRGDTIIATEVSRLGGNTAQVLEFIEALSERKVCVYIMNHNLYTLRPDGSRDNMAQAMLTFGAEFARIEHATTRERIQSGVDYAKSQGVTLGRRKGSTKKLDKLLKDHDDVVRALNANQTVREVATITKKSPTTVTKVSKALKAKDEKAPKLKEAA